MSCDIIYRRLALRFDSSETGLTEDLIVLTAVCGSSNVTRETTDRQGRRRERLARDWTALAAGTMSQVLRRVIYIAGGTYGGSIKVGSRTGDTQGSTFVAGTRRILAAAAGPTALIDGRTVSASFGLPKADPEAYGTDTFDGTRREYFLREDVRKLMEAGQLQRLIRVYGPEE